MRQFARTVVLKVRLFIKRVVLHAQLAVPANAARMVMKEIRYEWQKKQDWNADDILSIISWNSGLEIAQLRRLHDYRFWQANFQSAYSKNVWSLRPTHYSDVVISEHLGDGWETETYKGFETVSDFKLWLEDRRYRSSVS